MTASRKQYKDKGNTRTHLNFSLDENQKPVANFLRSNEISVLIGPAGTGKDFIQMHYALTGLLNKTFEKLIISKPAVEAGASIGFLPGEDSDKLAPYKRSFIESIAKLVGKERVGDVMSKTIFEHVGFIRGNTFPENSIVILSEAQNLTLHQIITFVTRSPESTPILINGDLDQIDIKGSGLEAFLKIIAPIEDFEVMELGDEHQKRRAKIVELMREYKKYKENNGQKQVQGNTK